MTDIRDIALVIGNVYIQKRTTYRVTKTRGEEG